MKKIIALVLAIALVGASSIYTPKTTEAKEFKIKVTGQLKSIKVKWTKKNAAYYEVYRTKAKDYYAHRDKSDYKKIARVRKNKYTDRKVKKGKYYDYYVKAKNRKGKTIACTFNYSNNWRCKGLEDIELSKYGYGEEFHNDHKNIHLSIVEGTYGYYPKSIKYQAYRKEAGTKKYKKIKIKKSSDSWIDQNVEPMKTYTYKVRSYVKKGKKTYYSKFSNTRTMKAVDDNAKFDVQSLTPSGTYEQPTLEVIFKFKKTSKYSEDLYLHKGFGTYEPKRTNAADEDYSYYSIYFFEYSLDNNTWNSITNSGLLLKYNQEYYIKAYLIADNDNKIVFAGDNKAEFKQSSIINDNAIMEYRSKDIDYTSVSIDFLTGKGVAGCFEV